MSDEYDFIRRLLIRENELRLAPETQAAFAVAPTEDTWMDMVTELTFKRAARELGVPESDLDKVIDKMKRAPQIWPEHEAELKEISLWRKYNRAGHVDFKVGDIAPPATVYPLEFNASGSTVISPPEPLFRLDDALPTVIISSSVT